MFYQDPVEDWLWSRCPVRTPEYARTPTETDETSDLPLRCYYFSFWRRYGDPSLENRPIRAKGKMGYDHLHRSRLVSVANDLDADRGLANVQPMLRESHLVRDALRPPYAGTSDLYDRFFSRTISYHQHPADADFGCGSQSADCSFADVLLPDHNRFAIRGSSSNLAGRRGTDIVYRHWFYLWKSKLIDKTSKAPTQLPESPKSLCLLPAS